MISKSVRPTIRVDMNIFDEFKMISDKYGNFKELPSVHRALYERMNKSDIKITDVFENTCRSKEKNKYMMNKY